MAGRRETIPASIRCKKYLLIGLRRQVHPKSLILVKWQVNHQAPVCKKANLLPWAVPRLRLPQERLSLPEVSLIITKTNRFPPGSGKTRQPWRERILFWKGTPWVLKKSHWKTPDIFGISATAVIKKEKI